MQIINKYYPGEKLGHYHQKRLIVNSDYFVVIPIYAGRVFVSSDFCSKHSLQICFLDLKFFQTVNSVFNIYFNA